MVRSLLTLVLALACCSLVQAGLYGGKEPVPGPACEAGKVEPLVFGHFHLLVMQYTVESLNPAGSVHRELVQKRDALLALAKKGPLSVADALDLSVLYIRLKQYEEAVQLLTPLVERERGNFKVLANLGTAHQLAGRWDRAFAYLQQVRDFWPREQPGWTSEQLAWHRSLEDLHLRMVKQRYRESLKKTANAGTTLDELFGETTAPLVYIGDDGAYQAGKLAPAEAKKLPANALAQLQQLVLWFPDDNRLYWQMGELYNALGNVQAASKIMEDCVWTRRYDAPALKAHRPIIQEAAARASIEAVQDQPPAETPTETWMPATRQLVLVGGVAGTIVLLLVYLQVREFRRRRRSARS